MGIVQKRGIRNFSANFLIRRLHFSEEKVLDKQAIELFGSTSLRFEDFCELGDLRRNFLSRHPFIVWDQKIQVRFKLERIDCRKRTHFFYKQGKKLAVRRLSRDLFPTSNQFGQRRDHLAWIGFASPQNRSDLERAIVRKRNFFLEMRADYLFEQRWVVILIGIRNLHTDGCFKSEFFQNTVTKSVQCINLSRIKTDQGCIKSFYRSFDLFLSLLLDCFQIIDRRYSTL